MNTNTSVVSSKDWLSGRQDFTISAYDPAIYAQAHGGSIYVLPESVAPAILEPSASVPILFGTHVGEAIEIVRDWINHR